MGYLEQSSQALEEYKNVLVKYPACYLANSKCSAENTEQGKASHQPAQDAAVLEQSQDEFIP